MEKPIKLKLTTTSPAQTITFAKSLVKVFQKGTVVTLNGDLGAGKTHFVKGLAEGLGATELVTSPTFTILNVYESGRLPLYHFDMYRLESAESARELGFDEYFDKSRLDGVVFVEWPENVEGLIKDVDFAVTITKTADDKRTFVISASKDEK